jgi:hypothetical protein
MGLFNKKGLSDLKRDMPIVGGEVGIIILAAAQKLGIDTNTPVAQADNWFQEVAKQLKTQLGYKLSAEEVKAYMSSREFLAYGDNLNELLEERARKSY